MEMLFSVMVCFKNKRDWGYGISFLRALNFQISQPEIRRTSLFLRNFRDFLTWDYPQSEHEVTNFFASYEILCEECGEVSMTILRLCLLWRNWHKILPPKSPPHSSLALLRKFSWKFWPLKNIFGLWKNGRSIRHQSIPPLSAGRTKDRGFDFWRTLVIFLVSVLWHRKLSIRSCDLRKLGKAIARCDCSIAMDRRQRLGWNLPFLCVGRTASSLPKSLAITLWQWMDASDCNWDCRYTQVATRGQRLNRRVRSGCPEWVALQGKTLCRKFRYRGTSARTTLLETALLRTPEIWHRTRRVLSSETVLWKKSVIY